ncbi:MAG TPA: CSLREA domain-containing protein [Bacteroidetes bacterium]|nr:CSLREA domain-containing protein [Bacteroidota bacterium]
MRSLLVAFLLSLGPALAAQTFTVTSAADPGDGTCDATCTLRDALLAAGENSRIAFDPALSGAIIELDGTPLPVGDVVVDADGLGIVVDARQLSRAMEVEADAEATILGLTIRNGRVDEPEFGAEGGGIWTAPGSSLLLIRCILADNYADGYGGGIHAKGVLTLVESRFERNGSFESGGGVFAWGELNVQQSAFADNYAGEGGGLAAYGGLAVITSTFERNLADGGDGGGIWGRRASEITGSTFYDNETVGWGGAVAIGADLTMERSTVVDNVGDGWDGFWGGVYAYGALDLRHSTIVGNRKGGVGSRRTGVFEGNIVFGNEQLDCSVAQFDSQPSAGYNVVAGTCPSDGPGDIVLGQGDGLSGILAPALADNGGPTHTLALVASADNPALDVGGTCGPADQRGEPAPADGDGDGTALCDAGAYELAAGLIVAGAPGPDGGAGLTVGPSPFRTVARVTYEMEAPGSVRLAVFDLRGRALAVVAEGERAAGVHEAEIAGAGLAPGVYVVRLAVDGEPVASRQVVRF